MKKVLLPLAFLGMTMAATTLAVADDLQGHRDSQSILITNQSKQDALIEVLGSNCKAFIKVEVKKGKCKHVKVCSDKPFFVKGCFTDDDHIFGGDHDLCSSKKSFCEPQVESPRFVNIFDNKWSPAPASMDGNKGPILLCVGKQDHHHDH